tara:strand:- start:1988 stop:2200 length:213 start_codon:yes stop_codon:yes gene_type:complete
MKTPADEYWERRKALYEKQDALKAAREAERLAARALFNEVDNRPAKALVYQIKVYDVNCLMKDIYNDIGD